MTVPTPIRIGAVEDLEEDRAWLSKILSDSDDLKLSACCASAEAALETFPRESLDVIILDVDLGGIDGIECVRRLLQLNPNTKTMILTGLEDETLITEALMAGALGYAIKSDSADAVRTTVRNVARGHLNLPGGVARRFLAFFRSLEQDRPAEKLDSLSPRQSAILEKIAAGYLDKEIVHELQISAPTLRTHIREIFRRLHVSNRGEAAARYWAKHPMHFPRLSRLGEARKNAAPSRRPPM